MRPAWPSLSFRFWDFGIGSGPNSSANFDVQTGSLIDELEWVRTYISSFDGWKFVNHEPRGQRSKLSKIRCRARKKPPAECERVEPSIEALSFIAVLQVLVGLLT